MYGRDGVRAIGLNPPIYPQDQSRTLHGPDPRAGLKPNCGHQLHGAYQQPTSFQRRRL